MNGTMVDLLSGYLSGDNISESKRTLGDLKNVFQDEAARAQMNPATIVYEVQSHMAVKDGTPGGLFFGTSNVMPGQVGGEYFMTKGHYHARRECGEYYWCIQGTGALILMDESGADAARQPPLYPRLHRAPPRQYGRYAPARRRVLAVRRGT